ncbi:MAG: hypothetical protein RR311_08900 [Comamonas sp.]
MNFKIMSGYESKTYEIAKTLAAVSFGTFISIFFINWPTKHIDRPPPHLTNIIRVTALSNPYIPRKKTLVEMKGKANSEYGQWWYFSNIGSILNGIRIGDSIEVWVSDVDDPAFGGRGYIWQVRNLNKNTLLITPDQIKKHNDIRYRDALLYLYVFILVSLVTAIGAIHYFRIHRRDQMINTRSS